MNWADVLFTATMITIATVAAFGMGFVVGWRACNKSREDEPRN